MYELRFYRMLSHEYACTSKAISWEPTPRGFANAVDLVRLICKEIRNNQRQKYLESPRLQYRSDRHALTYDYYEEQYFYFYVYCFSDTYLT